jgi:hypothetical protein
MRRIIPTTKKVAGIMRKKVGGKNPSTISGQTTVRRGGTISGQTTVRRPTASGPKARVPKMTPKVIKRR